MQKHEEEAEEAVEVSELSKMQVIKLDFENSRKHEEKMVTRKILLDLQSVQSLRHTQRWRQVQLNLFIRTIYREGLWLLALAPGHLYFQ